MNPITPEEFEMWIRKEANRGMLILRGERRAWSSLKPAEVEAVKPCREAYDMVLEELVKENGRQRRAGVPWTMDEWIFRLEMAYALHLYQIASFTTL